MRVKHEPCDEYHGKLLNACIHKALYGRRHRAKPASLEPKVSNLCTAHGKLDEDRRHRAKPASE